ncbi:MAG: type 4a pilus biogenesis protein PilO [Rhodospirillaceae bacterium]|nr:type 4a pilus biogenesis protein PilO [Rhodospirillaceae bacterium]MDE0000342.1 type 4a pilus biogenesis protein PilO [Rhodospirillaceae bacterium]MDE0361952.1 type 4a pilus biogenesis protein PilO [Rhodospirillaceae bacterium]
MTLTGQLRSTELSDPGRWPPSLRSAAVAVALAAVLLFGARVFAIDTEYAQLRSAQREEADLRRRFEQGQRRAADLAGYREQIAEIERSFGTMLGRLSPTTELSGLLADVSQAGLNAGLEERLFHPMEEQQREFYAELAIQLSLSGDYHQFGRFVSDIAAIPRLVTLHDIHIRPLNDGEPGELVLDVTARTYRHLDAEEGPP